MLDESIIEQLRGHFSSLASDYVFSLSPSQHASQTELKELLESLVTASSKLSIVEQGPEVATVQFELLKDGVRTGVTFRGVPGGHEFTSLVLALLNADKKGRLPDEGILRRVRALRGPIELRTYISLSCTNCPDVVQALNLMALQHPEFSHTMVDGGLVPEEISRLGIQAVPTVFAGDALLHVGKGSFSELLERLEEQYGISADATQAEPIRREFDVVVVGGGPAGAAAAIYSARKGLKTALVAQKLGGQVQETMGIENLISVPHTDGPRLAADLHRHIKAYEIEVLEHRKAERLQIGVKKELFLQGGELLSADAIILATGARWRELGIPGEKEYLGKGVAFCPHCDGPFYKGKRIAVVGGGNSGVEAAIDLAGICAKVTLVEYLDELKADAVLVKNLRALPNVEVITGARTTEVIGNGQAVTALNYQDRASGSLRSLELDGVFVQIGLVPNSAIAKDVVELSRFGEIVVDAKCRTNVPGIYAAGDVTTVPYKQIVIAMGEGAKAALAAYEDRIHAG